MSSGGMWDKRRLLFLAAQLSVDRKRKANGKFLMNCMFELCTQSSNILHPQDWNVTRPTQRSWEIVSYSRVFRLHGQSVDVIVALLNMDGTLDSRLAAILRRNVKGYGDSSYNTMNHCLTLLALHHYKRNKQLGNYTFKSGVQIF